MILLPIGRDESEIRRHAWISYAIVALNILAFVAVETATRSAKMVQLETEWNEALQYIARKPYLKLPPAMAEVLRDDVKVFLAERSQQAKAPAFWVVRSEQKQLNEMADEAVGAYRSLPHVRFGYIPSRGGILPLVTSMFIHAGFLHIFGNLLFFFLSGPFIEDVFGRPLFAALYLSGGLVAGLTYAVKHADSVIPLVGASGAIAAVMGAYLVRFLRSKVEFLFVPFLLRPTLHFRFFVPAFVVLPLWFVQQWWQMGHEDGGAGVAFSAHVGGFVYGAAVALIVKLTGFEDKFVNPAVERETTWVMDERTVRAIAARDQGDYATARRELSAVLREKPGDIDSLRTAVDVAIRSEDMGMLDSAATRLLSRYAEEKQADLAADLINELSDDPHARLPKFLARAALYAERVGDRDWALTLYQRAVHIDPTAPSAVASLVKIGTLLKLSGDSAGARDAFVQARAHPGCTAEWAPTIEAKISQLNA
jgi:membrane associated rhomboid family serine protease